MSDTQNFNLGRVIPRHLGNWDDEIKYYPLDEVIYLGSSYRGKLGVDIPVGTLPTDSSKFVMTTLRSPLPDDITSEDNEDGTFDITFTYENGFTRTITTPNLLAEFEGIVINGAISDTELLIADGSSGNFVKRAGKFLSDLVPATYFPGGVLSVERIPPAIFQAPIVSSGAIADLSVPQQGEVRSGSIVATSDGVFWMYTGSGSKTSEASYREMADKTPLWSTIADKPTTLAGYGISDAYTKTVTYTKTEVNDIITAVDGDIAAVTAAYLAADVAIISKIPLIDKVSYNPSIHLLFSSSQAVSPSWITRASLGTYLTGRGTLKTADAGVLRVGAREKTIRGALFEIPKTNLALASEDLGNTTYWVANGTTVNANVLAAPDLTSTADKIVETAGNALHGRYQAITWTAAGYTVSTFARAAERSWICIEINDGGSRVAYFDLVNGVVGFASAGLTIGMTYIGNGWYRCWSTRITAAVAGHHAVYVVTGDSVTTYNGTGTSGVHIWGWQVEATTYPTSYIRTTTGTVTRAGDKCVLSSTTYSDNINPEEGTGIVTFEAHGTDGLNHYVLAYSDGTGNNAIMLRYSTTFGYDLTVITGGVAQATLSIAGFSANVRNRIAFSYKANAIHASINGGAVISDVSATLPVMNQLSIGNYLSGDFQLSGFIEEFMHLPMAESSSKLPELSKL